MSYPTKHYGYDLVQSDTYRGFTIDGQEANPTPCGEYNHGDRLSIITELSRLTWHKH
jgi:hypothetical protein